MFGHDDNTKNDHDDHDIDNLVSEEAVQEAAVASDDAVSPAYTPAPPVPGAVTSAAPDDAAESVSPDATTTATDDTPASDVPPVAPAYDASDTADDDLASSAIDTSGTDGLLGIKQDALQQLSPLVGHLNQTPEEKFRTTMMMIQASDNQALIKDAYAAARAITDDKTRAQALLDIINEINYFTRQS